jgi:hypothetical protein
MIKTLHKMGVRSNMMYMAGVASIGLAAASWYMSTRYESAGLDRADRWGLFVGEWAPTFFAMGVALRIEETHGEQAEGAPYHETAEQAATVPRPSRAGV